MHSLTFTKNKGRNLKQHLDNLDSMDINPSFFTV